MRAHQGLKGRLLQAALDHRNLTLIEPLGPEAAEDLRFVAETARSTVGLTQDAAMLTIIACVREAVRREGALAELGVFRGATAKAICREKGDRALHLFDVFESLQGTGPAEDAATEVVRDHFGRVHGASDAVKALLGSYANVHFHVGVFPGTASEVDTERFCFVHLDLDLPEGTRAGLEFFYPRLERGGILIGDDYHSPEVRGVFDDYFRGRPDPVIGLPWGQALVVRL